jgi:uncharacterized protein (TIGR02271 family)
MTAAKDRTTVVGVFQDRNDADRAVDELRKAGFRNEQIGVVAKRDESYGDVAGADEGSEAGVGALAGMVAGAGIGGLVGLGIIAGVIPVLGPVIAGGTLATILANAAGGAAIAGVTGALIGAGVPEHETEYYHGEFEAGRTLVTVQCDGRVDEATAILRRHHSYDLQTSAARGGTAQTTTARTSAATATATSATAPRTARAGETMELREEELHARKTPVQTGEVRVRKEVTTEHKTLDVPVQREEVVIERHPASGHASSSEIREGEELRIPVMEEQVNVEKRAVVKEEVSVGKRTVNETEHVSGDVRKENVRVERKGDADIQGCDPKGR